MNWISICRLDDIVPGTGVGALVDGRQLAVFRLEDGRVFAIDNFDPNSGAHVLARGIVGDLAGEPVVASPIYKQHFRLADGVCIEQPDRSVTAHAVELVDGSVRVALADAEVQVAA